MTERDLRSSALDLIQDAKRYTEAVHDVFDSLVNAALSDAEIAADAYRQARRINGECE